MLLQNGFAIWDLWAYHSATGFCDSPCDWNVGDSPLSVGGDEGGSASGGNVGFLDFPGEEGGVTPLLKVRVFSVSPTSIDSRGPKEPEGGGDP